jgi:hypothetical protein
MLEIGSRRLANDITCVSQEIEMPIPHIKVGLMQAIIWKVPAIACDFGALPMTKSFEGKTYFEKGPSSFLLRNLANCLLSLLVICLFCRLDPESFNV